MYIVYSAFLVIWGILLMPVFLYRAWRYHKYLPGLSQRLGHLPESLKYSGRSTIWFHACSVGETLSLQPLVKALRGHLPDAHFVFSTITQTGQLVAGRDYGPGNTFYFPVDLARIVKRTLDWIRPDMIVIIDTEIWPNLVHQAQRRGIPVVLANGRISAGSFRYYRWARPILKKVLRNYRLLMMQSSEDAERIATMGAPPDKTSVTGNIKFDKSLIESEVNEKTARDLELGFLQEAENAPLIVAGSTHEGEESILLDVFRRVRQNPDLSRTRLLLAPRHPERFNDVAELVSGSGLSIRRRSIKTCLDSAEVFLLDTVGELAAVYRFATIAFVGGTLVSRGGHSIMEPALYSRAIVAGPSMDNFRSVVEEFRARRAICQIDAPEGDRGRQVEQLTQSFVHLLQNTKERESLGTAAYSILERNRGAARLTAEKIAAVLNPEQSKVLN